MTKKQIVFLVISMFMVYTQGLWERLFSLPPGTTIIVELPIWVYLFLSYKKIVKPTPVFSLIVGYIILSFLISLFNQSSLISWFKYIRFFVYFYLIYSSLWNSSISPKQWKMLFNWVLFLVVIQGIGSIFNIFVLNQRIEGHVGLMSTLGGTTASTFPLLIISLVIITFFYSKNNNNHLYWWLILIVISVIMVGYGSGKRAIFFSIPIFLLLSAVLVFFTLKRRNGFLKKIRTLVLLLAISLPVYIYGMTTSKGLNYGLSGNENSIGIIKEAFDYAQKYESATSQGGETIGRSGTTFQIIKKSTESISLVFFGSGFGSVKNEDTQSDLGVGYGIVGFTRDIVSGGWVFMILTVLILSRIIFENRSVKYLYSGSLRLIVFAVFLFTHFGYSSDFVVSLKINFLLIPLLVFINSPSNYPYLNYVVNRFFYAGLRRSKH